VLCIGGTNVVDGVDIDVIDWRLFIFELSGKDLNSFHLFLLLMLLLLLLQTRILCAARTRNYYYSHKQTASTSLLPLPQTKSLRAGPRLCNSWTRVPRYVVMLLADLYCSLLRYVPCLPIRKTPWWLCAHYYAGTKTHTVHVFFLFFLTFWVELVLIDICSVGALHPFRIGIRRSRGRWIYPRRCRFGLQLGIARNQRIDSYPNLE
jgi:hypothetical protein